MTDIRIGDRVRLPEAEVVGVSEFDEPCPILVRVKKGGAFWVSREAFLASERIERPIAEGDRVRIDFSESYGKVKAIDDGMAWVRLEMPLTSRRHADIPVGQLVPAPLGVSMEGGE